MDRITLETFVHGMLKRFAEAGECGIDRRYVPSNILGILQERGHITKLEATPRITPAGRTALEGGDNA